jgi:3D (Asp-Asp-Asp) domain-containing protein
LPLLTVFAVVLAAGALLAAFSPAPAPALRGSGSLRARGTSLAQREQAALLDLYAAESQLARARATAAAVAVQQAALAREQRTAARRAGIIRASLQAAQLRVGQALRDLYVQGQPDPIAIFLGATSLDQAIAAIDSAARVARQNRLLIADMRRTQASVRGIERTLAARSRALAVARSAADASAARLRQAVSGRAGVVSSLRKQRDITQRALAQLERRARAAQQRSAKLSPPSPPIPSPAPATTAAATTTTAAPTTSPTPSPAPTPPVPTSAPDGTRTLVVDAVAYHLPGKTASGLPVGVGVIAVDPLVIPLGTRVFVPGYGPAVAADVGSAIKGNIIDLWMPTTAQARAWGRRTVTITIYG